MPSIAAPACVTFLQLIILGPLFAEKPSLFVFVELSWKNFFFNLSIAVTLYLYYKAALSDPGFLKSCPSRLVGGAPIPSLEDEEREELKCQRKFVARKRYKHGGSSGPRYRYGRVGHGESGGEEGDYGGYESDGDFEEKGRQGYGGEHQTVVIDFGRSDDDGGVESSLDEGGHHDETSSLSSYGGDADDEAPPPPRWIPRNARIRVSEDSNSSDGLRPTPRDIELAQMGATSTEIEEETVDSVAADSEAPSVSPNRMLRSEGVHEATCPPIPTPTSSQVGSVLIKAASSSAAVPLAAAGVATFAAESISRKAQSALCPQGRLLPGLEKMRDLRHLEEGRGEKMWDEAHEGKRAKASAEQVESPVTSKLSASLKHAAVTPEPGVLGEEMERAVKEIYTVKSVGLFQCGYKLRYCRECRCFQPLRTKHCADCEKCVRTFDHHCPWLGSCVGENNRRSFFWFLFAQSVELAWTMVEMALTAIASDIYHEVDAEKISVTSLVLHVWMLFSLTMMGFLWLMVVSLMVYQLFLGVVNLTTWENVAWHRITYLRDKPESRGSPFSRGLLPNLGAYFLILPLPRWLPSQWQLWLRTKCLLVEYGSEGELLWKMGRQAVPTLAAYLCCYKCWPDDT